MTVHRTPSSATGSAKRSSVTTTTVSTVRRAKKDRGTESSSARAAKDVVAALNKKKAGRPPAATRPTQRAILHPRTMDYLRLMTGVPIPLNTLDPPHQVARTIARTTPWRRFVVSTGNNGLGYVLLNPFAGITGTMMLDCGANAGVMAYGPLAWSTNKNLPYVAFPDLSVNTSYSGWSDGYIAHPDGAENFHGERRWLAIELEINYLGTNLNCGGEYQFVRNGGVLGLTGLPLTMVTAARDTEIRPITMRKQRFYLTPRDVWESTFHRSTVVGLSTAKRPVSPGDQVYDPEITGFAGASEQSDILFPYSSDTDTAPAHKGWNVGLVLRSAANGQDFQVSVRLAGEADLTEHSSYGNILTEGATNNSVVARAHPTEHALVTTMHAHASTAIKHSGGVDRHWFMTMLRDECAKLIPGAVAALGKGAVATLEKGLVSLSV